MGGLDLGVLSRPLPQLSLAATVHNAEQPATSPTPRAWALAVGLRPLGERVTLGADYLFGEAAPLGGRMQYTAQVGPFRGLRLLAGVSHGFSPSDELLIQAGVTLDLSNVGLTYAVGSATGGLSHQAMLHLTGRPGRDITSAGGKVALFDLPDLLRRGGGPLSLLGLGGGEDPFLHVTRLLEAAERDDTLRGIVLKIDDFPDTGLAKSRSCAKPSSASATPARRWWRWCSKRRTRSTCWPAPRTRSTRSPSPSSRSTASAPAPSSSAAPWRSWA